MADDSILLSNSWLPFQCAQLRRQINASFKYEASSFTIPHRSFKSCQGRTNDPSNHTRASDHQNTNPVEAAHVAMAVAIALGLMAGLKTRR